MKQEHLESARATGPSLVARLRSKLDLLAIGVPLFMLALHFAGVVLPLPSGRDAALAGIRAAARKVETALGSTNFDLASIAEAALAWKSKLAAGIAPAAGTAPVVPVDLAIPPDFLAALREGASNVIRFLPPVDVRATAVPGRVQIAWSRHEDNNVAPSAMIVLRSERSLAPTEVARLGPEVTSFDDETVTPGVEYSYRIVAATEDPAVRFRMERTEPSLPARVTAIADFRLSLADADPDKQTAEIIVEKWKDGTFWQKRFKVAVGEAIGVRDDAAGVDYACGRVLRSLKAEAVTRTTTRHEVVFDADAKVRMVAGAPVTEELPVTETSLVIRAEVDGAGLPKESLAIERLPDGSVAVFREKG